MKTLETYAMLKAKIKELEGQCKEIEPYIFEEVKKQGGEVKEKYGTFSICQRKSYVFSPALTEKIEKIEAAKKKEIEKGKTSINTTEYLRFAWARIAVPPGMIDWDRLHITNYVQ